jgi:hypothetical protein
MFLLIPWRVDVPQDRWPVMNWLIHIRFICACGKRMKAPAQYASRRIKCPQCGIQVKIPNLRAQG